MDLDARFREAVQRFWVTRDRQGAATGGAQMAAIEALVVEVLEATGLKRLHIHTGKALELPGYFRPEKKWDLLVVADDQLVTAIEFKSQISPSFGKNFNNRAEEAIGSASDLWTAYREGRLGNGPRPFLGYFFLLEDCPAVHGLRKNAEPYFEVDPILKDASYSAI